MKTMFKNYSISSKYEKMTKKWDNIDCFEYTITVYNKENKKRTSFKYFMGYLTNGIKKRNDLLFAFYCFLSDAVSGMENFYDFCADYGYDNDSIKALNIHKECKQALRKIQRVATDNIYDLLNSLSEYA